MINDVNVRLSTLIDLLDIPEGHYEKAVNRYQSLNDWFKREASSIAKYNPLVYPQGSFRYGTVIRPLTPKEEYDLDVVCHLLLQTKTDLTQQQLKELIGAEVKAYADAKGINAPVVERKRAWRLDYADGVSFHIDIIPCVPEDTATIQALVSMHNIPIPLATSAIALTCKSHPDFQTFSSDWPTGNPIGHGLWFDEKMGSPAAERRRQLVAQGRYGGIEKVPAYALKTPLQRAIQLLKRHRDVMFSDDPELKPISIIITTLASHAYNGERLLYDAVNAVLSRMQDFVRAFPPRVANPTNPVEDFADKWKTLLLLEQNFKTWHAQACRDFASLATQVDPKLLAEIAAKRFAIPISEERAREIIGTDIASTSKQSAPIVIVRDAPKPWGVREH